MSNEAKLGGFVLIGIVALIVSVMLLGDFQFTSKYSLNILFKDIAGLPSKSRVKIAGVEVGGVKKITLEGNLAKVTVWLRKDIPVHDDAIARIVSTGLIGSKFLELTMGSPEKPVLKDGDTLQGIEPISFDKVMTDLMEQLDAFTAPFKGQGMKNIGQNLSDTLENLKKVSDTLKATIADHEERINDIVKNVDIFSKNMADITSDNKDDVRAAIKDIKNVSAKLDAIVTRINNGEGIAGKLVSDKQMGEDMKKTMTDLKDAVQGAKTLTKRLQVTHTDWEYRYRYDGRNNLSHNDFGLRILPSDNKFYYLGVENIGDRNNTNDIEDKNTIDAQIGGRFPLGDFYLGAIRSKAGVGMKIKPLWKWDPWKRLEFTADIYDFSRVTPVPRPQINTGIRIGLTKWLYLGSQLEDLYYQSATNTYANLVIRDDDIAYLLGIVGLGKN